MKRKAILSVLCALIFLIAVSPSSSAATNYGDTCVGVLNDHADVNADMRAFDDVTGQPLDPGWEWNPQNNRWEFDYTLPGAPQPPAQIAISVFARWHDFCDPFLSATIQGWVKLTVTQIGAWPPNIQTSTFNFNNGNWYTCDGTPHIFVEASVCQVNVPGQQQNSYDVEVEVQITIQGVGVYNDYEWGRLIT